ncbi:MAG: CBS domain-containing protein [Rhodospirillales bacterium]|nr:CBS domain-containing protein [Rhodospirillales bacterium]
MITMHHLLEEKGHTVWSVGPDDTVLDAIKLMALKNIGALLVVEGGNGAGDGDGKPVGIFTERDYARNVILKGKSSPATSVRDVMAAPVICVSPEKTVDDCMALMTEKRVRHLPVMDDGQLAGMISIGDLVKSIIEDQQHTIEQLEHYIHG